MSEENVSGLKTDRKARIQYNNVMTMSQLLRIVNEKSLWSVKQSIVNNDKAITFQLYEDEIS